MLVVYSCMCVFVRCVYESEWEGMRQLGKQHRQHRRAVSGELVCACNIVSSLHLFYTHRQYKYRRWYHATTLGNRWLWYIICYRVDRTHSILDTIFSFFHQTLAIWIDECNMYKYIFTYGMHTAHTKRHLCISIQCCRRIPIDEWASIVGILAQVAWTHPLSQCWAPLVNGKSLHVFQATFNSQCNKNRRTLI